jgi:hypothetical protein
VSEIQFAVLISVLLALVSATEEDERVANIYLLLAIASIAFGLGMKFLA